MNGSTPKDLLDSEAKSEFRVTLEHGNYLTAISYGEHDLPEAVRSSMCYINMSWQTILQRAGREGYQRER